MAHSTSKRKDRKEQETLEAKYNKVKNCSKNYLKKLFILTKIKIDILN